MREREREREIGERARADCTPLCATAFVRMQAEIRASVYGPGLYGNGRKKRKNGEKKKGVRGRRSTGY